MSATPPTAVRIVALTPAGAALGRRLHDKLAGSGLWLPAKLQPDYPGAVAFKSLKQVFKETFTGKIPLIGIMAAGIVVRHLAPLLKSKAADPAIVVMDEQGRFAVSLLSGHLGGANDLARRVADLVGATPVITTATDVQGLPAMDCLAVELGLAIENLQAVKVIQMAWLRGEKVRIVDADGLLPGKLTGYPDLIEVAPEQSEFLSRPGPAVYVGFRDYQWPEGWLRLRPKLLMAGMGCNKGTPTEEILGLVQETFKRFKLSLLSLHTLATIAVKQEEPGLRAAARQLGVDFIWYTKEELEQIPVPNPSAVVQRHVGVAGVCEAAALKAAGASELLVPKQKTANATLAVARAGWPW